MVRFYFIRSPSSIEGRRNRNRRKSHCFYLRFHIQKTDCLSVFIIIRTFIKAASTHKFITQSLFCNRLKSAASYIIMIENVTNPFLSVSLTECGTQYERLERGDKMLAKDEMPACPVATTVALIGSKWKLLIMRNLRVRPWRFNELRKDLEGISQKVLTDSLRSMEDDGIIVRVAYPEVPPRVEYSLSELGRSMLPIIHSMEIWGMSYQKQVNGRRGIKVKE